MSRPYIIWTEEMVETLMMEYPITFNSVLAQKLGVSVSTIQRKASELGLVKAGTGKRDYKIWETVEKLFPTYSQKQIAQEAGVSERTVRRICKALNLKRDREEDAVMRSKGLKRIYDSDSRRILYGLEQKVNRCLGRSHERLKIYDELKRYGYIVIKGSRTVYYSSEMRRIVHVESYATALGLILRKWNCE